MIDVLKFIIDCCPFIFTKYGAEVVGGWTDGINGYIDIVITDVQIRVSMDRKQLFVLFAKASSKRHPRFYSIDLFRTMLTGEVRDNAVMDSENIRFFEAHFSEIVGAFLKKNVEGTTNRLKELVRDRLKRWDKRIKKERDTARRSPEENQT